MVCYQSLMTIVAAASIGETGNCWPQRLRLKRMRARKRLYPNA